MSMFNRKIFTEYLWKINSKVYTDRFANHGYGIMLEVIFSMSGRNLMVQWKTNTCDLLKTLNSILNTNKTNYKLILGNLLINNNNNNLYVNIINNIHNY